MSAADVEEANRRLRDFSSVEFWKNIEGLSEEKARACVAGWAGFRVVEVPGAGDATWRLVYEVRMSLDGTADNAVECGRVVFAASSKSVLMQMAYNLARDGERLIQVKQKAEDATLKGLPEAQPIVETASERAKIEAEQAAFRRGLENYAEGQRAHLHNRLVMDGSMDLMRRLERKYGTGPHKAFGKLGQVFDLGRNRR